jgi:hypothetical protein
VGYLAVPGSRLLRDSYLAWNDMGGPSDSRRLGAELEIRAGSLENILSEICAILFGELAGYERGKREKTIVSQLRMAGGNVKKLHTWHSSP